MTSGVKYCQLHVKGYGDEQKLTLYVIYFLEATYMYQATRQRMVTRTIDIP